MTEIIGPTLTPQEMRWDYLVPIYVMWTSNVPEEVAQASLQGVVDAVNASGQNRQIISFGSRKFGADEYSSADWYVEEALRRHPVPKQAGFGTQVLSSQIGQLFIEEPWQDTPHWEVLIINHYLTAVHNDDYLNFVFGVTDTLFPSTIQSITRIIRSVEDIDLRNQMIRRLLRHEVGHMFGLPGRNFNVEQKLGLHCTNTCSMRQGMSIPEWAKLTKEENSRGIHFCADCLGVLTQKKANYKPLPI